jgi:flavodoxin I
LIKKGGSQVLAPAGFFVLNTEGPLKEGELERAAEWVKSIE